VHRIEQSLHESLQRLGTDYLDILLCHDIEFGDPQQIINETLPALQRLKQQGDTRAIGISGLPLNVLRSTTQHTAVDVVLSYCHYTLSDTTLTHCLPTWLAQNIGVINASPLGMGLFSENPLPAWHPAPPALQQAAQAAQLLCQNTQTPLSQIALQFALQAPGIATTLIGMASEQQVIANVAALNTAVDHVLLAQLQQHFAPVKDVTWPSGLSVWS
jgi:aryl-alcohol dehydrogenase-like predicted oxidoreductase